MKLIFTRFPKGYQSDPNLFDDRDEAVPKTFEIYLAKTSYKEGTATYNGRPYSFFLSDDYYNVYPGKHSYSLKIDATPGTKDDADLPIYHSPSDELVKIGNGLFKIPKEVRDTLKLQYVRDAKM